MRRALAALVLLTAATAVAQESAFVGNAFDDASGDAPAGLDIQRIYWLMDEGSVSVELDEGTLPNGSALTAILFVGAEGVAEPDQTYVLHTGPEGDRVMIAHDGTTPSMQVHKVDDLRLVTFDMDQAIDGDCAFAVARTVTYHQQGQQVEDVVGWTDGAIEDAWDAGRGCGDDRKPTVPLLDDDGKGIPAVGAVPLMAILGALAWSRRRKA